MTSKGVLLDLDDTLYAYQPRHDRALQAMLEYTSRTYAIDPIECQQAYQSARQAIHQALSGSAASHHRLLYFQRMLEQLNYYQADRALACYQCYWDAFLDQLSLSEDALWLLNQLKSLKFRIALVTDLTAHIQFRKIVQLKLDPYLDAVVTSEEAGHEKPHPYMFMLALKKLQLTPHDVCMIGDHLDKDITGSLALGMNAIWLNRHQHTLPLTLSQDTDKLTIVSHLKEIKLCQSP